MCATLTLQNLLLACVMILRVLPLAPPQLVLTLFLQQLLAWIQLEVMVVIVNH